MGGISIWQIVLILLVIGILFGAGRLPSLGRDLGKAIKGFRRSMEEEDTEDKKNIPPAKKSSKRRSKDRPSA